MADILRLVIVVGGDLVPWIHLPRQPQRVIPDALIVDARRTVGIKAVGDDVVVADVPVRAEEPEPVALDRPAERRVRIEDEIHGVGRLQAAVDQILREVVGLKRAVGVPEVGRAVEPVAAFTRDEIEVRAAGRDLGAESGGLDGDFLAHRVVVIRVAVAATHQRVHLHPVDVDRGVFRHAHVRRQTWIHRRARAADILVADLGAHRERALGLIHPGHRDRIEEIAAEHRRPLRVLHVDDRRLPRDRHRFFDGSKLHLGIDRGREIGRQVDAVLDEGREARDGEGDLVDAGTKVDDRVSSLSVADRGAHLLDDRRTRRFDRDARQHGARRVLHETGDAALGRDGPRQQQRAERCGHRRPREHFAEHESSRCVNNEV